MAGTAKVSIIVPVYNVPESALRKCLESTISQTISDIEIIVVDDGSTDRSGLICDEYAQKDSRIKVIHKENGGLSAARNTGYRESNGQWITFLDSDDWIEPTTCEELYRLGVEKKVEIVIFGTIQEFEHYKNPFKYHYKNGVIFLDEQCKQLQREILNYTGNIATAWAKLIRKDVLDRNHIEHNEELRQGSEGIEFNIRLFDKVQSAVFTDKVYYHYVYNPNSISAKHDEKNHHYVIKCFEEIERQIESSNNSPELLDMLYQRVVYVLVAAAVSGYFSPNNPESYKERCHSFDRYMEHDLPNKVINTISGNDLDIKRKIVYYSIKKRKYVGIQLVAMIRFLQKRL